MFEVWRYSQAGRSLREQEESASRAAIRMFDFRSEDPPMPFYCRDPAEMKRDHRYANLSIQDQDKFNRLVDEMWIGRGWVSDNVDLLAEYLGVEPAEAERLRAKFLEVGLIEKHGPRLVCRELREQYVRAVLKSEIKDTSKYKSKGPACSTTEKSSPLEDAVFSIQ